MEIDYQEEIPISSTLNQNFPSKEKSKDNNKEKNTNYNLRYGGNFNGYNELDSQTKNIINDPKYANEKRSKSAFSKKSFREKYEPMKIKVPSNREWNRDPTAEVIIHNLEQKIDILTYENFLLSKKLREIESNNKELKLNISNNLMIMKAEQELNNGINDNINNKKQKKKRKEKNEQEEDISEEINKLKDENNRLRLSNQNLAENNAELNKVIDILKEENNLYKNNKDSNKDGKNNRINDNKNDFNQSINLNNNKNNIDNNIANLINNNSNETKMEDEQNNSQVNMNEYLQTEQKYHNLIEENELLHKKLRTLLLIEKDPKINILSKSENNNNNIIIKNKKDNKIEDLSKENYILKQKIKSLNGEINKMAVENNRKILIIQDKLDEYEEKQRQMEINRLNASNDIEKMKKEEELDEILNETILAMNRNQDDEESKKMIDTIKNIKNEQKKRISQCLIINNKLKSLLQENAQLHNQLLMSKKENEIINNTNSNFNNTNSSNINNSSNNPHICFCGSGNFSVNALKIKDEMIIKYKDKIDENNEILKLTQKSDSNSNNNKNNELNFIEKDYNVSNKFKKERNDGFEDYLLGKIVNNQKEVLGERAPRFYESNNNNKFIAKSMQFEGDNDINKMNNRYNNYHYRSRITEDDE